VFVNMTAGFPKRVCGVLHGIVIGKIITSTSVAALAEKVG